MKASEVTAENYYSPECRKAFSTNSDRKTFSQCQFRWMSELQGDWIQEDKAVFLHGKYVDCALTESPTQFAKFCDRHVNDIYGRGGKKLKVFLDLDEAINVVKSEPLFMFYMKGEGQHVLAFEDFHGCGGVKMRLDNVNHTDIPDYHDTPGFFSDLKAMKAVHGREWVEREGKNIKVHWADVYDYFTQISVYQEGLRLKYGKLYPAFIPAMEKVEPFNREVFWVSQDQDALFARTERAIEQFGQMNEIKQSGKTADELKKCGVCKCCIKSKVLHRPTPLTPELIVF
jgi:hypothetical protein